jgi:hypothetical protein
MECIIVILAIYRAGFTVRGVLGQPECEGPSLSITNLGCDNSLKKI